MFLRFTVKQIDENSHRPQGVFAAAYELLDSCELVPDESKRLRELLQWFDDNLPEPPENFYASRAMFWFKASAHESINRIWELVQFLRLHDYQIEVHKSRRLANVSYEDDFQVAAYPRRGMPESLFTNSMREKLISASFASKVRSCTWSRVSTTCGSGWVDDEHAILLWNLNSHG